MKARPLHAANRAFTDLRFIPGSGQFLGIAQVVLADGTPAAILTEKPGRADEIQESFPIQIDISFLLKGAEGFFFCLTHDFFLSFCFLRFTASPTNRVESNPSAPIT